MTEEAGWASETGVVSLEGPGIVIGVSAGRAAISATWFTSVATHETVVVDRPKPPVVEPAPPRVRPQVVIDEILADPPPGITGDANGDGLRDGQANEFVEILNWGGRPVDIGGWTLSDDDVSEKKRFRFPEGTILEPGERAVVFGGGEPAGVPGAWETG